MKKSVLLVLVVVLLVVGGVWQVFFRGNPEDLVGNLVILRGTSASDAFDTLFTDGYAHNEAALKLLLRLRGIPAELPPGAYRISKGMNMWALASRIADGPFMKWVVIPEGYRKEEIAEVLARELGWSNEEKKQWVEVDTAPDTDHTEGVYFPDTYLIPVEESPARVAERLRARWSERFAPLAEEAATQNIKWTTLMKIASLVQREAAGMHDMPLIAGVIWNRLLAGQRLEIDATLQYVKGSEEGGWWLPVRPEDKQLDSPFNTYKNAGLPPRPIANPGIAAMEAVLFPEVTECFFYLHDPEGNIHCAKDYAGHQANIERYLR
jgi:UPF0755 protein